MLAEFKKKHNLTWKELLLRSIEKPYVEMVKMDSINEILNAHATILDRYSTRLEY